MVEGGQGVVACGELITLAAHFENKFCRAFPLYGAQRRGAPLTSFASISDKKYSTRSQILPSDYVIILDTFLPKKRERIKWIKRRWSNSLQFIYEY